MLTSGLYLSSVKPLNLCSTTRMHPPGISLTASAYDGVVIVIEYGIADLRELTSGEKAMAIASIAHPKIFNH